MKNNMFRDQTIFRTDTTRGDCFRACIATIIDWPTEKVPHFVQISDDLAYAFNWLSEHGYEIGSDPEFWNEEGLKAEPLHIIYGPGPRGCSHSVVGDTKTGKMVHDPHPSRAGLIKEEGQIYLFKKVQNVL